MAVWTRKSTLTEAVSDWETRGLLDADTAKQLQDDIGSTSSGFAFQNILILLAVVCIGFAAMTFVAANWDDMARLTRVGIVFATMWGFWGASALFHAKGQNWFAQVFTLGACAMFGAGIMLISQIYHIQGSPKDATWLWAMGTLLGAALTRSTPALCLTIVLLVVWVFVEPNMFSWRRQERLLQPDFAVYMALCAGLAYWMSSRFAGHLIVIGLCAWAVTTSIVMFEKLSLLLFAMTLATALSVLSTVLFSDRVHNWLRGFERAVGFYCIFTIGALFSAWHVIILNEWPKLQYIALHPDFLPAGITAVLFTGILAAIATIRKHPNTYDLIVCAIFTIAIFTTILTLSGAPFVTEAIMLAGSIWIIRMGWRIEYRPIAVLGFIAFGLVMLLIYFETVGTLLGTSMFYLVAGVLLLAGVFLIPRLTRTTGGSQ